VRNGVTYKTSGSTALAFDLFRPASAGKEQRLPVFVIFKGFGGSFMRNSPQARGWAGIAAAHGFAAVTMETTSGHVAEDFDSFVGYLRERAAELQLDPEQIAVIAWSGNAGIGLETVEDLACTPVKAAVIYYGGSVVPHLRLDLPVFLVRAGLDGPSINVTMNQAIAAAIPANAPWTVLNYPAPARLSKRLSNSCGMLFPRVTKKPCGSVSRRRRLPRRFQPVTIRPTASLYAAIVESHPQDAPSLLAYGRF
jgi:dienelactone hydrolase